MTENNGTITFTQGQSGHSIKDEGTALTQRTELDFVGMDVTASDDATNTKTQVKSHEGQRHNLNQNEVIHVEIDRQVALYGTLNVGNGTVQVDAGGELIIVTP